MLTLTLEKKYKYPYIGKHNSNGCLVLFTSERKGISLHKSGDSYYIGGLLKDCSDKDFDVHTTPITICNKP